MSSIKKEEEEKQKSLKLLTLDSLTEDWQAFKSNIKSKSVLATLKNVLFEIGTKVLTIYVPTARASEVLSDSGYFIGFNDRFKNKNIDYVTTVDSSRFPEYSVVKEIKKPKNEFDKYEKFVNKNPDIDLLRKALDLKLDN